MLLFDLGEGTLLHIYFQFQHLMNQGNSLLSCYSNFYDVLQFKMLQLQMKDSQRRAIFFLDRDVPQRANAWFMNKSKIENKEKQ